MLAYETKDCQCSGTKALKTAHLGDSQVSLRPLNPTMFYRSEFQILTLGAEILFLMSFLGTDILSCFQMFFFLGSFSPVDLSKAQCLWLAMERRVMRFCGQQRERLCTEMAAGAAVTVAVLFLAPHCSQDEVHRCSHSVRRFIGCLKQCISVKNSSS